MADNTSPVNISIQLLSGLGAEAMGIEGLAVEIQSAIGQCTSMTRSIYTGDVSITEKADPEVENERYFVFDVGDSGTMGEMLARLNE